MSKVFVSTDARRAYPRGVIGSTVGAYPRGTGSNPVEGNGHFFPAYRQLHLSSFSDTHTHTHLIIGSGEALPVLCVRCARCVCVRERERERERERVSERERDGSDVTLVALKLAMSFALFLAKMCTSFSDSPLEWR